MKKSWAVLLKALLAPTPAGEPRAPLRMILGLVPSLVTLSSQLPVLITSWPAFPISLGSPPPTSLSTAPSSDKLLPDPHFYPIHLTLNRCPQTPPKSRFMRCQKSGRSGGKRAGSAATPPGSKMSHSSGWLWVSQATSLYLCTLKMRVSRIK